MTTWPSVELFGELMSVSPIEQRGRRECLTRLQQMSAVRETEEQPFDGDVAAAGLAAEVTAAGLAAEVTAAGLAAEVTGRSHAIPAMNKNGHTNSPARVARILSSPPPWRGSLRRL